MKKLILLALVLFAAMSCKQNGTQPANETDITAEQFDSMVDDVVKQVKEGTTLEKADNFSFTQLLGDTLVAMQIWDEDNEDVYAKYGYEFLGNCYACDVANIVFTEKKVSLFNACLSPDKVEFNISETKTEGNKIAIQSGKIFFVIERIEDAPIYTIKIKGDIANNKQLRIAEYYSLNKALHNFHTIDCGDFDG